MMPLHYVRSHVIYTICQCLDITQVKHVCRQQCRVILGGLHELAAARAVELKECARRESNPGHKHGRLV